MTIEQEPKPSKDGVPPAYWPASGNLKVEKLAARYSPEGPKVLHDISFNVKAGQRIGIGGYTLVLLCARSTELIILSMCSGSHWVWKGQPAGLNGRVALISCYDL